ncbi:MAG TPA: DNA internalization-related competence protein ComEC/Rec2 [Legionella sp.]|nr:DNA internalization-related competence protein ComEC/Rec2 [Legionella sp.]
MEIFCFLIGIIYVYTHNHYLLLIVVLFLFITPRFAILNLFFLGMFLAWGHQYLESPSGFPKAQVIPHALIRGVIDSIPLQGDHKTQFVFRMSEINGHPAQGLVQLSWYNQIPALHANQHWQLSAKLKRPKNFNNPGSYDYVTTLATRHILWTGYINGKDNQLLPSANPAPFSWLPLREHLSTSLVHLAPDKKTAGVIAALTLNLTSHIGQEEWNLFRRTGTTHLFGISGEHIALLSGLVFWIIRNLWTRSSYLCLRIPAISVASICGLTVAVLYAFLAGFAPPVQRALIGCLFYTIQCLGKQRLTSWQIWRYAIFGVLFIEPHAVFMQGFYFSFLAVACILLTQQRWRLKGYNSALAVQLSCLIGLMPLTLYWFSYGSINGFFANLFAIPLVGFFIIPLALLTMLLNSYPWAWLIMKPLGWLITILFSGLTWVEHLALINITWPLPSLVMVLALLGALLIKLVLPVKPFNNIAGLWLLIPLFSSTRPEVQSGELLVQILDVGQGLAVVLKTKNHIALYDTGDQFFQGSDLGKMVILPFFKSVQIKKVDKIIISHPDKDHRGGLQSIEEEIPVSQLLVNNLKYFDHEVNCHDFQPWTWDDVHFRFLPINKNFDDKNNNSCILQVRNATSSILLAGDIEQVAEDYLVTEYGEQLKSDILIVPHHGSKTSSSYRFLLEVQPRYAIASLGFDNRFHFPHAQPLENMHRLDIPFYRTDECGMTQLLLPTQGQIQAPQCYSGR